MAAGIITAPLVEDDEACWSGGMLDWLSPVDTAAEMSCFERLHFLPFAAMIAMSDKLVDIKILTVLTRCSGRPMLFCSRRCRHTAAAVSISRIR